MHQLINEVVVNFPASKPSAFEWTYRRLRAAAVRLRSERER